MEEKGIKNVIEIRGFWIPLNDELYYIETSSLDVDEREIIECIFHQFYTKVKDGENDE